MTFEYKLIKGQTLTFDYESKKTYTDTYYSFEGCSNIVHKDDDVVTPLEGEIVTYKDGLIQVYSGMDLIARVKEIE